jgi:hypothetical protein
MQPRLLIASDVQSGRAREQHRVGIGDRTVNRARERRLQFANH